MKKYTFHIMSVIIMIVLFLFGYSIGLNDGYADGVVSGSNSLRSMVMLNDIKNGNNRLIMDVQDSDLILRFDSYPAKRAPFSWVDLYGESYARSVVIFRNVESKYRDYLVSNNKIKLEILK